IDGHSFAREIARQDAKISHGSATPEEAVPGTSDDTGESDDLASVIDVVALARVPAELTKVDSAAALPEQSVIVEWRPRAVAGPAHRLAKIVDGVAGALRVPWIIGKQTLDPAMLPHDALRLMSRNLAVRIDGVLFDLAGDLVTIVE